LPRKFRSALLCALAATSLVALAAPAAQAATEPCDPGVLSQPFASWADLSSYAAVPGGTFEAGAPGWTLSSGASLVADNDPWHVSGAGGTALSLRAGASATSPSFCGGLAYPTVRLFAKGPSGLLPAIVSVDILYTGGDSLVHALPLGLVVAGHSWEPSLPMLTLSGLPLVTGSRLALRITAILGPVSLDDVYVDPYRRLA
jgi:hypothetical protein